MGEQDGGSLTAECLPPDGAVSPGPLDVEQPPGRLRAESEAELLLGLQSASRRFNNCLLLCRPQLEQDYTLGRVLGGCSRWGARLS